MGYMVSHRLLIRVRFLQQYLQFLSYIETEVRFSKRLIYEIIKNYSNENEFGSFLNTVCDNVENSIPLDKAFENAIHKLPACYGLLKQDIEFICEFGRELGGSDTEGQIELCRLNKSLISSALQSAREEKNKKSKLYLMLGSSFGICLTIILF